MSTLSGSSSTIPRLRVNPSGSPITTPGQRASPVGVAQHHCRATCQLYLGRLALTLSVSQPHRGHLAAQLGRESLTLESPSSAPGLHVSYVGVAQNHPQGTCQHCQSHPAPPPATCQPCQSHHAPPPGRVSTPSRSPGTNPGSHVNPIRVTQRRTRATCEHRQDRPGTPQGCISASSELPVVSLARMSALSGSPGITLGRVSTLRGRLALTPARRSAPSGLPGTAPASCGHAIGVTRHHPRATCQPHQGRQGPHSGHVSVPSGSLDTAPGPHVSTLFVAWDHPQRTCQPFMVAWH